MNFPTVLFVLPIAAVGGGANSVVQEVIGLTRLGVRAEIAVASAYAAAFATSYPELAQLRIATQHYRGAAALAECLKTFDIAVATTNGSVAEIDAALRLLREKKYTAPRIAYYVQDYEPLFYAPDTEQWKQAYASYTLIADAVLFAKTHWIGDVVHANHGVQVHKVEPSIDHDIYYPHPSWGGDRLSLLAMLRPQTPRRAPKRTIRILELLADEFGRNVSIQVFGVEPAELESEGLSLSARIANRGVLRRQQVPDLLRTADMFLDLSDYQAFSRTGLESMACGGVPVLPVLGGTSEYARHGHNSYVVDTRSDDAILEAVQQFIRLAPRERTELRQNALETAAQFTIAKSALSELRLFTRMTMQ